MILLRSYGVSISRFLAFTVTSSCFLWTLLFVSFSGSSSGGSWYQHLASRFVEDAKGGAIILSLAIPILLAGSVASLLTLQERESRPNQGCSAICPSVIHRVVQLVRGGDFQYDRFSVVFLVIPAALFFVSCLFRKVVGLHNSRETNISKLANMFGMVAFIAFAFVTIPVARYSSILKLLQWSQAHAIRLHIWLGRIIIASICLHGGMHMYRWKLELGESLSSILVPPGPCWTPKETDFQPVCLNSKTDCTCYHHFRNFTGLLALLAVLTIAVASVYPIRRAYYKLFYVVHIVAVPLTILMAALHYHRAMLYLGPCILYYAATSFPVLMELYKKKRETGGVKVVSVERIPEADSKCVRPCVSITMEASNVAMQRFQPGHYVYLRAPSLSCVSHPFTINRVPGKEQQLRIIFRSNGPNTAALEKRLTKKGVPTLPNIYLDGFHGVSNRVSQVLQHDVVSLVAGGIGITPFLSLLHRVQSLTLLSSHGSSSDGICRTQEVNLHWICREESLIRYIRKEYFDPLLQTPDEVSTTCRIRIFIHQTRASESVPSNYTDAETPGVKPKAIKKSVSFVEPRSDESCVPFTPSRFATGCRTRLPGNLLPFFTFSIISWVGLYIVWYCYTNYQSKTATLSRVYSPVAIVVLAGGVAVLVNYCSTFFACGVSEMDAPADRRHDGKWFSQLGQSEPTEKATPRLEMSRSISSIPDEVGDSSKECAIVEEPPVTLEVREGRPAVHEILNEVDTGRCPGIFFCGPPGLMKDIRAAARERSLQRLRQCVDGVPGIALYEEAFQL